MIRSRRIAVLPMFCNQGVDGGQQCLERVDGDAIPVDASFSPNDTDDHVAG